ncbi:aminotransferase class I/II-fold pyridoxal phosphate-dependent enzyme [Negadavirga shengliensis]|uniref:Aminotransferase class I/II-fold pyridoxal phosphate-dependent enzyme n=1 Tax=Negadavirga shengliensis TaxID=1389218 RepID=A0ABV9SV11_9BACT
MKHYHTEKRLGRFIEVDGRQLLHFSGTSYLGMGALPEFRKLVSEGAEIFGPCHGSSRHSNVRLGIYDRFEQYFAKQAAAEKALVFSSGYMAGSAAVQTIAPTADLIMAAPDSHPAILPIGYRHDPLGDFSSWADQVIHECHIRKNAHILLLANAVNPLIPEVHDFHWIDKLSRSNRYTLVIDDSHAFGVIGNAAFGSYSKWQHLPVDLLIAGSMAKALALPGGILLGNHFLLGKIEQHVIFRSSSPPAPGPLHAFLEGQDLYLKQHVHLKENIKYIYEKIKNSLGFRMHPDYPVISFLNERWVDALEKKGIILSSFSYPSPDAPSVNRLVLSAHHRKEDLDYLLVNLEKVVSQDGESNTPPSQKFT